MKILLTGKTTVIRKYLHMLAHNKELLYKDTVFDFYPENYIHYTEYNDVLEKIKKSKDKFFCSQNLEFILFLLKSDFEFELWTCYEDNDGLSVRKLEKSNALTLYENLSLELR